MFLFVPVLRRGWRCASSHASRRLGPAGSERLGQGPGAGHGGGGLLFGRVGAGHQGRLDDDRPDILEPDEGEDLAEVGPFVVQRGGGGGGVVPATGVYFVNPSSRALTAASLMCCGVSKSGSPALIEMTSIPSAFISLARPVTASVMDGLIAAT